MYVVVSLVLLLPLALVISILFGLRHGWFEDGENGAPDGTLQSLPVISIQDAYARTVVRVNIDKNVFFVVCNNKHFFCNAATASDWQTVTTR